MVCTEGVDTSRRAFSWGITGEGWLETGLVPCLAPRKGPGPETVVVGLVAGSAFIQDMQAAWGADGGLVCALALEASLSLSFLLWESQVMSISLD